MKRFYAIFLTALLAAAAFVADAQLCTVYVHVSDPSLCTVFQYYYPGGNQPNLEFDASGEAEVVYPDGVYKTMLYLYVTPVTPAGSDQVYFKSYQIYDSEGELLKEATVNKTVKTGFTIPVTADGGTVEIDCGVMSNYSTTVNLTGDPSKVAFTFGGGRSASLAVGSQQLDFSPGEANYVNIRPVGVSKLYSVKLNGVEVTPRLEAAEGGVDTYNYTISSLPDKSTIDIETDYPDVDCNITISCNDPAFVQEVTVDGEPVESWNPLVVKAGSKVRVVGDSFNYIVNQCSLDGVATQYASSSMSATVATDTEFGFDVTRIERDQSFIFYAQPGTTWNYVTKGNSSMLIKEGYTVVPMAEADLPVFVNAELWSDTSENAESYLFLNSVRQPESYIYELRPADGDVVKGYTSVSAIPTYAVTINADDFAEGALAVEQDYSYVKLASWKSGVTALPGTQMTIASNARSAIGSVKVDGVEVTPGADGKYEFTVNSNSTVDVTDDGTSGVDGVVADTAPGVVYNLQGQRLNVSAEELPAGLYIVDGRKVYIKK